MPDSLSEDGYIRDRCVYGEHIDICDTMNVGVRYAGGALFNYSLIAYSPYEGWRASLTGSKGRMEIGGYKSGPSAKADTDEIRILKPGRRVRHASDHGHPSRHPSRTRRRGRAAAPDDLRGRLDDPLGQQAGSLAGAYSLLIGAAAG